MCAHKVLLFGCPLSHSVSPAMHHAAADYLGIALQYSLHEVDAKGLPAAVSRLREAEYLGANITLPHKPAMLALVDEATFRARRIGAINTVYKRGDSLVGDNTDALAVSRCLREKLAFRPGLERVVLAGAGGAARAVAVALLDDGVADLSIWNRTPQRATELVADLERRGCGIAQIHAVHDLDAALAAATIVVNATSVGLDGVSTPFDTRSLPQTARLFDLVYGVEATPLVRACRRRDVTAEDGLWMLVYQAAAAFKTWTGSDPPESLMYHAAVAALVARSQAVPATMDPA